ncbi:nitrate/nitrite transporter [Inquilinus sp. Marseille-Q2685]|uniref:MFS transporter n=1 Tax=Inquilinus sp. Marseille-Q2685 TaxID=2866581 RepID=UPI001CE4332B|nr:MFS transporter [Inquilinus sp. Marseille-Q2685]
MSSAGRKRSIEAVVLFTAFIASTYGFGMYLFPAIVEAIRRDLPFTYDAMGVISGFVQAGFMLCALLSGLLTVRFGALPMILGSIAVCAACLCGLALVTDVVAMGVLLAVLGGCAAAIWVPMVEVSSEIVPRSHQGKALGLMSSGTSYGVFVNGLLITGFLATEGWRFLWATTGAIVAALALAGFLRLRRPAGERPVAEAAVPRASIGGRLRTLPPGLTAAVLLMMFLNGLSCMPYQTYLSTFLQGEVGLSQGAAAMAWSVIGVVGMVGGFAIGALADRITVRWAMVLTYLILAGSCLLLLQAALAGGNLPVLYLAVVAFGLAFYAIFGLVPAYIGHVFGTGKSALVFAFGNIALGFGGIVGNMAGGWLKVSTGSFQAIYLAMLAAALCSALLAAVMPSERRFAMAAGGASA